MQGVHFGVMAAGAFHDAGKKRFRRNDYSFAQHFHFLDCRIKVNMQTSQISFIVGLDFQMTQARL